MNVTRMGRRARLIAAIACGGAAALVIVAGSTAATASGGCQPGSGPQLAGRHLTSAEVSAYSAGALRCANLAGADLHGLGLAQVDLTGANLRDANLQHSDLTQAMLDHADLSGANLTDATLIQASATHAKLVGANLSGADLTQADLTGADLSKAKLSGTSFTQTTLGHTTFTGATGLLPWNLYVLIVAALIFVLLATGTVRRSARNVRNAGGFAYSNASASRPGAIMLRGLLGALVVALGFSLAIGGLAGQVIGATGPPITQTCAGPLCKIGVSSGFAGIFGGIAVIIAGSILRASRRSRQQPTIKLGWQDGSPFDAPPFS